MSYFIKYLCNISILFISYLIFNIILRLLIILCEFFYTLETFRIINFI